MTTRTMARSALAVALAAVLAAGAHAQQDGLAAAARAAMGAGEAERDAAIATLRAAGPRGLQAFVEANARLAAADVPAGTAPADDVARFRAVLDRVAAQRDAWAARLYWFTDLDAAKQEATRTGRPILSLRLLGRLDEELSCANSRFFRTALYPDARVNALLCSGFVLHWSSERPVPRVTIDYGDGRVLERTVTGNSIHWVLAPDGRVLDALPGLYGPGRFANALEAVRAFATGPLAYGTPPAEHLRATLAQLRSPELQDVLANAMAADPGAFAAGPFALGLAPAFPAAANAISKLAVERPLLPVAVGAALGTAGAGPHAIRQPVRLPPSPALAFAPECRLDAASLRVLRTKVVPDIAADPASLRRTVAAFERLLAADTLRNELWLRPRILDDLAASAAAPADLDALNRHVYATVFLTPADDPWLGLVTPDVFTAIDGGGVRTVASEPRAR